MRIVCINKEVDQFVSQVMISMGIMPSLNGYCYFKVGIELFMFTDYNMNEICAEIAERLGVSKASVERDMRTALNVSYSRELHKRINDFAGIPVISGEEKLCAKEFIAVMSEVICYTFKDMAETLKQNRQIDVKMKKKLLTGDEEADEEDEVELVDESYLGDDEKK